MSRPAVARTELQEALSRAFESKRARLSDLPVLCKMLADLGARADTVLTQCASMHVGVALGTIFEATLYELIVQRGGGVVICATIPEWSEPAVCQLDRQFLFRAFDAMYGGAIGVRTLVPDRPLTSLERSLAALLGGELMRQLAQALVQICPFSVQSERCADEGDIEALARKRGEYLMIQLRIEKSETGAMLAIPVACLERARDRLTVPQNEVSGNPDPSFSSAFRRNVGATPIEVIASAEGPRMLLSDVARLLPGSTVEFEGSRLRQVLVEVGARPIFIGRLGQSKGVLTICLERADASVGSIEGDGQA
jgi:flagellar motor switch protein FliM